MDKVAAVVALLISMVFLMNAGEVNQGLGIVDWVLAILFAVAGAKAGWDSARK